MSRIVPWMCREEWLATYHNLYNFKDTNLQMKGVSRVQAWKSRSAGKLPLSIDATAGLIAVHISDVEESQKNPQTVRLAMAMAIIRFVNGMVDMEQKGAYARSVQSIADDIGLPDWLVDLRHEATHAGLPSLEVLRVGCQFSLDWLQEHYWEAQIMEIKERDDKLIKLFQAFAEKSDGGAMVTKEKKTKKERKKKNQGIIKEIVDMTCEYDMWDAVLDLLIGKQNFLIRLSETLQKQLHVSNHWPDISEELGKGTSLDLPREMFELWSPVFKALHKENGKFLSKLVIMLIRKVFEYANSSKNILHMRYLSCWIYFILLNSSSKNKEEKQWKINAELDFSTMLEVSLQNYCSYTSQFLPLIVDNVKHLSERLKEKLKNFCTINFSTFSTESSAIEEEAAYDRLAETFPILSNHVKLMLYKSVEVKHLGWQLCDATFSSSVPFGCLIGSDPMQFERLELPGSLETASVQDVDMEASKEDCDQASGVSEDIMRNSGSLGVSCDSGTSHELSKSAIESITQQILIF